MYSEQRHSKSKVNKRGNEEETSFLPSFLKLSSMHILGFGFTGLQIESAVTLSLVGYGPGCGVSRRDSLFPAPQEASLLLPLEEMSHECASSSGFRVLSTLTMDTGTVTDSHCFMSHPLTSYLCLSHPPSFWPYLTSMHPTSWR